MSTIEKENPLSGIIAISRRGVGYVRIGEDKKNDIVIPEEHLNFALHGDLVEITEDGTYEGRPSGRVARILERSRLHFIGTSVQKEGVWYINPDDMRILTPLQIDAPPHTLTRGQKVFVKLLHFEKGDTYPVVDIVEIIGPAGEHEVEMRAIVLSQGFGIQFPPEVREEALLLEKTGREALTKEATKRRDFRNTTTFTIDPVDAKDFDDALSIKDLGDGTWEIGVHIADVAYFVRPGTHIDDEARKRATSIYLVDRTIPMLPDILSTDLCSLRPHEDRLAMSAVFTLNTRGEIIGTPWFGETVIHSDRRFTYEDAQEVLERGEGDFHTELTTMAEIARNIRNARTTRGAISFDTDEVRIELDEKGAPVRIYLKERKETNLLIEDFMLLANEAVAKHMYQKMKDARTPHGFIYRAHDAPDVDRIEELALFLRAIGYDLAHKDGRVSGQDINRLFRDIDGKPEETLIKTATIRSMAKAVYTTKNIGHFGLAFEFYTHFTSPIRRYPDLIVHRLLKHAEKREPVPPEEIEDIGTMALHSSEREVAAANAERDSIKLKQVEFLADKVGQEFDATVSGTAERGMFVTLNETKAEGMVRLKDVGDDYFSYDEGKYRIVGTRTGASFSLGDPVRVRLTRAHILERQLDFVVVPR